jgi:hypothetical protein
MGGLPGRYLLVIAVGIAAACKPDHHAFLESGDDAGVDPADMPNPAVCPSADPQPGSPCTGEVSCNYGVECCDGQCSPSETCGCSMGTWTCFETDACLGAGDLCGGPSGFAGLPSSCTSDDECARYCQALAGHSTCCDRNAGLCTACDLPLQDADAAIDGATGDGASIDGATGDGASIDGATGDGASTD